MGWFLQSCSDGLRLARTPAPSRCCCRGWGGATPRAASWRRSTRCTTCARSAARARRLPPSQASSPTWPPSRRPWLPSLPRCNGALSDSTLYIIVHNCYTFLKRLWASGMLLPETHAFALQLADQHAILQTGPPHQVTADSGRHVPLLLLQARANALCACVSWSCWHGGGPCEDCEHRFGTSCRSRAVRERARTGRRGRCGRWRSACCAAWRTARSARVRSSGRRTGSTCCSACSRSRWGCP